MQLFTPSSPHIHTRDSVTRLMLRVIYALVPGIAAYVYFFGWNVVINIAIAGVTALVTEAIMLLIRRRPLRPFLSDSSALLTAVLLALTLPPLAPWWIPALGAAFAIIIAKHLYGGLGYNPFNPAMAGYAMLLISFPREMTRWAAPQSLTNVDMDPSQSAAIAAGTLDRATMDAVTMATPLDALKTQLTLEHTVAEIINANPIFSGYGGLGWEWINLGFLLGGVWLVYRRVIQWHIPASFICGLGGIALIFYFVDPAQYANPLFHLFSGATMLGAFFIATDPVTASTTPRGRLIYGCGIGALVYVIRVWGGYPDAVAFSVLIFNVVVPTLDHYTQPRVYGHMDKGGPRS